MMASAISLSACLPAPAKEKDSFPSPDGTMVVVVDRIGQGVFGAYTTVILECASDSREISSINHWAVPIVTWDGDTVTVSHPHRVFDFGTAQTEGVTVCGRTIRFRMELAATATK